MFAHPNTVLKKFENMFILVCMQLISVFHIILIYMKLFMKRQ